jgi:hypothetical protein
VFVHAASVRNEALELIAAGLNDCEIARRLGIPRTTVRDWRRPRYRRKTAEPEICQRCWRPSRPVRFTPDDYAELLGLYLGDGHITVTARVERMRIFLDARYSADVDDAEALLRRCFPGNRVGRISRYGGTMAVLCLYHQHLSCLFPQHGPGKKHERAIAPEPWQLALVREAPWAFLRGCVRSDGCVFVNRTGRYRYISYEFSNLSREIRALFAFACASVGVEYRINARSVRVYRRASVALLVEHVGSKS